MTLTQLDRPMTVFCPNCSFPLFVADSKLFGRKARCGGCGNKFRLENDPAPGNVQAEIPSVPKTRNGNPYRPDSPKRSQPEMRGSSQPNHQFRQAPLLPSLAMSCPYCHAVNPVSFKGPLGDGCVSCGAQFATSKRSLLGREIHWQTANGPLVLREWQSGPFGLILHGLDVSRNLPITARRVPADAWVPAQAENTLTALRHASKVSDPRIAPLTQIYSHQDQIYLIGSELRSVSLGEWMLRKRITPNAAAALGTSLAKALATAHRAGIVHRDLKPANILLTSDAEPILLGFGLPRRKTAGDFLKGPKGIVIGTLAYLAPEQAAGNGPVDPRSDIYSLGAVLFHILTGRLPFPGTTQQILGQLQSASCPPPSSLRPDLPWEWDVICKRCLAKSPQDRYQNVHEMMEDLAPLRNG